MHATAHDSAAASRVALAVADLPLPPPPGGVVGILGVAAYAYCAGFTAEQCSILFRPRNVVAFASRDPRAAGRLPGGDAADVHADAAGSDGDGPSAANGDGACGIYGDVGSEATALSGEARRSDVHLGDAHVPPTGRHGGADVRDADSGRHLPVERSADSYSGIEYDFWADG